MKCQRILFHPGPGRFGSFTGQGERCALNAGGEAHIVEKGEDLSQVVKVCHHHLKEIVECKKGGRWSTPAKWYVKEVDA